ncbi:unnamed protein product, partial [Ectocarpus sp. 13 AM-2016]
MSCTKGMTTSQALGAAKSPLYKLTYPSLMRHNALEVDDGDEPIMMKDHDGMVRPLKEKLRTLCKQRRIRLQEFFKPYDVHHHKKVVSKGQFRRALDQAGLTAPARGAPPSDLLTVQEVEALLKRYEVKGDARTGAIGEEMVNYWKLCEKVEKVFTRRGLEKNPTLDVKLSLEDRPGSGYGVHRPGLSNQEADQVAALLGRVRLFSATEGLIVKSLFETFDKRHSGRVTSPIFLRQLDSMFKGRLSKEEARLLLRAYQTRDGSVSYRAMHADCDDASGSVSGGISPVAADAGATDVVPVQQQQQQHRQGHCTQLQKQRLAHTEGAGTADGTTACLSTDGEIGQASVEADEEDFDDGSSINSSVTGFPTRGAVGFIVGEEQGSGSPVSGRRIAAGCGGGWRRARGRTNGTGTAPPPKDSLPIERQMASKVVYHRLIPEDSYRPYDPTRSGSVTESVFRRGLSDAFRLPFSDDQLDTLTRRYRHGGNKVSFLKLCEHVYAIADNTVVGFGRQHQHQYPQQHERDQQQQQLRQEGGAVEESASERETIDRALEEIRATLRRRRLSIQPGFQEFDRKNEGHVSVGQLARVLCSFGVLPADHHTQELLAKRYAATDDPRHPTGVFIAYRHLLEDLGEGARGSPGGCLAVGHHDGGAGGSRLKGNDGGGGSCNGDGDHGGGCGGGSSSVGGGGGSSSGCCGTSVAASRVFGKPTGLSRPAHSVVSEVSMTSSVVLGRGRDRGLAELLTQLKAFTFRSRLRTLEFFRCDDPMRSGSMSREKFGRNLLSTGFRVSPLELETLCEAYVDPNVSDKSGAPFVRYIRLVEEIEGVFGVRELEGKPECDVDASVKAAQASFSSNPAAGSPLPETSSLSAEEEEVVMETLRELGAAIHRRRLNLTPPLRDFDRFNRGVVPGTMFDRVLSSVGLLPARPKARLLQRKFAERFSSPDSRSDVNYMAFLEAVEMAVAGHDKIPDGLLIRANASTGHRYAPGSGSTDAINTNGASSKHDVSGVGDAGGSVDGANVGGGRPLSLQAVVKEVARQLAVGWANIADFLNDADRLKQGEITLPKLKVALALAGVLLTNEELHILEHGFRSDRSRDMVDWRRLAVAVNKVGGPPVATSWNGEVFDPSVAAANNHRRSQHNHHEPRGQQPGRDSAPVPHLASGVPSPNTPLSPPLSPLSPPSPLGSLSSPAQQGQQEHRRVTCDGSSSATAVTNRTAARHEGAVMYKNMGDGSRGGDGGGVGAGWNRRPVMGGGGSDVGRGNEIGDAVDVEVLNKSLDAVRHRVKHYRMHLKPSFQDFDPNRKMKITPQQFLSVLGNMNLNLTEREQDTICRRY